jgi:FkbM family methyltransferase
MKAAAYLKSYAWRELPRMSPEEQLERIERHIGERGWELAVVLDDSTPEVGQREYPRLAGLLADPGDVSKVVVVNLDRVGRMPRRVLSTVQGLRERGIDLVCVDQGIDTGTDGGGEFEPTVAAFAHWQPPLARPAGWNLEGIRAHGFAPATVIDVGAASGTPPLYDAFDQAYLVLVEPLEEHRAELERLIATRPGEYHQVAAGSSEGTIRFDVTRLLAMSSAAPIIGEREVVETREVPVTTIDRLAAERDWEGPLGLKVDVEGYERQVIEGAAETLSRCEFVIVEASVVGRFEDDPTCSGLIDALRPHGFEVCDVLDTAGTTSSLYVDLMFRRV